MNRDPKLLSEVILHYLGCLFQCYSVATGMLGKDPAEDDAEGDTGGRRAQGRERTEVRPGVKHLL